MADLIIDSLVIPTVDISGLDLRNLSCSRQVKELHSAFTSVGFVFITNHGIERCLVDEAFHVALKFFTLPSDIKRKYSRESNSGNNGYVTLEQECIDPSKPGDLKEAFNICSLKNCVYPDSEVPSFKQVMIAILSASMKLASTILEMIGHALQLDDPLLFVKKHNNLSDVTVSSYTTARVLYYPPIPHVIKPGQLRCGEHVDYGSITLLFQDPNGGLQVKCSNGTFIDVPYRSDAILVNLGAVMQKWTSDRYIASPHRVLNPVDDMQRNTSRQSMAVFIHPDNDAIIECIDGSNKYPPVTAYEDTYKRLFRTYENFSNITNASTVN